MRSAGIILLVPGTINPLTCFDTLEREVIPCFSFVDVSCKPWTSTACECDEKPEPQGGPWDDQETGATKNSDDLFSGELT